MNLRKPLLMIFALGMAILLFWLMRSKFQSRTEPMEAPPTSTEQQEIKNLLPPTESGTQKKK